jgi:hypothetical protein
MPRECYTDPETEIPAGRWHATFRQIIRGRRGQRILRELEAILLAVPGHKLAKDQIVTWTGQACLIGEYVIARRMREDGVDRDSALVDLLLEDYDDWTSMQRSAELGRAFGMPWTLAWELAQANDTTVQEIIAQDERSKTAIWDNVTHTFHYSQPEYVSSPQERWAACLKLVQTWLAEGQGVHK